MKLLIYISGIAGGILLGLRVIGIYINFSFNDQLLGLGLFLAIICLTLASVNKFLQGQKIKALLQSYNDSNSAKARKSEDRITRPDGGLIDSKTTHKRDNEEKGDSLTKSGRKGLEPGKTSLRERKAGLIWSGGNIKGTTASRGVKRGFIKRW